MSTMYTAIVVAFLFMLDGTDAGQLPRGTPEDACEMTTPEKVTEPFPKTDVFIQYYPNPKRYIGNEPSNSSSIEQETIKEICLFIITRGLDKSPDTISIMSASKPGWYIRSKPFLYLEDIANHANPESFPEQTSFIPRYDKFIPGTVSFESVTHEGQFIRRISNSRLKRSTVSNSRKDKYCFVVWRCKEPICGGPCQNNGNWNCYCKCPGNYFGENCELDGGTLPEIVNEDP